MVRRKQAGTTSWRDDIAAGFVLRAKDVNGTWFDAKVVKVDGKQVLVHFAGWKKEFDEWFTRGSPKLQPKETPSAKKQKVSVASGSSPQNCQKTKKSAVASSSKTPAAAGAKKNRTKAAGVVATDILDPSMATPVTNLGFFSGFHREWWPSKDTKVAKK